jgi:hypothetical protein
MRRRILRQVPSKARKKGHWLSAIWQLIREVVLVVRVLPSIERCRLRMSLHEAVSSTRQAAIRTELRDDNRRTSLRRAIRLIDRLLPGEPNCVRRSLLEIRLDAGAAKERFYAGLQSGGGPRSGHAWLESHGADRRFDAVIAI